MNGWQEPNDGKRIYLITDNTKMDGFTDYIKPEDIEHLYVTYSESRVNLGIHYYRNSLYSSNLVGICRIKSVDDEGKLIGYYEKHEYRNAETMKQYDLW